MRRTKIIATVGPSSEKIEILENLFRSGVDVLRLNFSHRDHPYYERIISIVRNISERIGVPIGILADLSGPKIRVCEVSSPFVVHSGEALEISKEKLIGGKREEKAVISIDRPELLDDIREGDQILVADGSIRLEVTEKDEKRVLTKVLQGGTISSRKGINFPGLKVRIKALTEKDRQDLIFGIRMKVDYFALSFVQSKEDILECKEIISSYGESIPVFAKIETQNALEEIDGIIEASDGIMVARGDLGAEIPVERVPIVQKNLIQKARSYGKISIVATQMLNSMIHSRTPSRADVSDIANAVLDGADALMLSDETTIGSYPVESVEVMARTIEEAEKVYPYLTHIFDEESPDYAIAKSSCLLSREIRASFIVVFTKSGSTARRISRMRPESIILASVHDEEILRRLSIVWGVKPFSVIKGMKDPEEMLRSFLQIAREKEMIKGDETIVLTMGYPLGEVGSTSLIRVLKPDMIRSLLKKGE